MDERALKLQVVIEAIDNFAAIQFQLLQTFIQIEKVTVLAPLQERSQLGPEELFGLKRNNLRFSLMPAAIDQESIALIP